MPTYRRRGRTWRVEICHKGKRLSASYKTKVECERWATLKMYELVHGEYHPAVKKTLHDAFQRYLTECTPRKRGALREEGFIRAIMRHPICDQLIENVTTELWALWRDERLKQVSPGTVRREVTICKAMYKVAVNEWLWLRSSPLTNLSLPAEPPHRDRRVSPEEERAILQAFGFEKLRPPILIKDYVACAWLFALETAMRSGEILALTWQNVHLKQRYVHIEQSKTGKKRNVALSKKAIEILQVLPRCHPTCFKINSRQRDAVFRKYRKKSGVADMTFHDSRHEALTRLAQRLHILDLARMTGISNPNTLMVYYNATPEEIAARLSD